MWRTLSIALLFTACSLSATPVKIHGYITSIESPKSFEIDDYKITRDDNLALDLEKGDYPNAAFRPEDLRIGTELEVQGDFNDSTHELHAASVKVFFNDNERVKRSAVIEHAADLERSGNTWKGVIHADGQTIQVDSDTRVAQKEWQSSQLSPGMSINYEGLRNRDGSITATRLEILSSGSGKSGRSSHDSAPKVNSDGTIAIHGAKYKLVPDAEAQSYVQRVGAKLVPSYYQHELAGGAARREPFEFYLVANDDFNAHAFPNGTVLVNAGVLRVLTSEAQLAAVLGHEIAHATQEHSFHELKYEKKQGAEALLERGYAGGTKGDPSSAGYSRILENQADRIGLEYMVAAGYDPREAPAVWKQVAHAASGKSGFLWDAHDDATTRRSYLLAQVRNNYSGVDYKSSIRDSDEFDHLAERYGNTAIARHTHEIPVAESPADNRPGYKPPSPPSGQSQEKRYGANSVNILSDPPGAEVVMNGQVIGKTPMILPTGNVGLPYVITIQRAGYRSWNGQLVSVPGRTSLRVELVAAQ